jgi:hypothetical protein
MVVGKNGIQTFEVVIVVVLLLLMLSYDALVPISAHPFSFFNKRLLQIYLNDGLAHTQYD